MAETQYPYLLCLVSEYFITDFFPHQFSIIKFFCVYFCLHHINIHVYPEYMQPHSFSAYLYQSLRILLPFAHNLVSTKCNIHSISYLTQVTFATPAEEIAYLKKALEDKQQEVDEVESSFQEFQEFSKQLEEEMELELKSNEKKYAELLNVHKRLKEEHENTVV